MLDLRPGLSSQGPGKTTGVGCRRRGRVSSDTHRSEEASEGLVAVNFWLLGVRSDRSGGLICFWVLLFNVLCSIHVDLLQDWPCFAPATTPGRISVSFLVLL